MTEEAKPITPSAPVKKFYESEPGRASSSRLVMFGVVAALLYVYIHSEHTATAMPDLSWEHVAILLVAMGVKDIKAIFAARQPTKP